MNLTLGVTAHVDAGKTTLCEQILCRAGVIRVCGRVDHGDAFMDDDPMERARGITIFTEQAALKWGDSLFVTLMDTPGHVDFSGEMERALSVLDAALLVVSCAEGVQSHTVTLFKLLQKKRIPTLIFLNKIDREGADAVRVTAQMQRLLSGDCVLMSGVQKDALREELAARDEALLEAHFSDCAKREDYLEGARRAFLSGALFPVLAGSALMGTGVDELMQAVSAFCKTDWESREKEAFSAQVYRVRRVGGTRYAYIKAISGVLRPRDEVNTLRGMEKVSALMLPQGGKLTVLNELHAGQTAAVAGLDVRPGEHIGAELDQDSVERTPLMSVRVEPVAPLEVSVLLAHLRELEEEDPLLSVSPEEGGVSVGVMGAVQIEVLSSILKTRFGDEVRILPPHVLYKETIAAPVIGIGHYEPLRHYAETWLRLEPSERGSGITFSADCPPNTLDLNWQRLIETHIFERTHPGVLTGSPLTDVHIRLIAGRSHLKHTEGGDFREATCRAIRNGLMQVENILLEPVVRFELAMPLDALSRVTGELLRIGAQLDAPETEEDEAMLTGSCTAAMFWDYPTKFAASTRGHGRISSRFWRYEPCRNQAEIVEKIGYNPLADTKNPTGSVFCSHGAGFYVAWDHVREWAHCEVEEDVHL